MKRQVWPVVVKESRHWLVIAC